jgi:hypothetical protein
VCTACLLLLYPRIIESLAPEIELINAPVLFFINLNNHESLEEKKGGALRADLLSNMDMDS